MGMKQILVMMAAVVLVGCGNKTSKPDHGPEKEAQVTPKPPPENKPITVITMAYTNSLGMIFKSVPGTDVAFSIWETRVKEYSAYADTNEGLGELWKDPDGFAGPFKQELTHPVVMVSVKDAQAFCKWLTKKEIGTGKIQASQKYRLPTDAEWSIAVGLPEEKGETLEEKNEGIKGVYPWGNTWPPPKRAGNYQKNLNVDDFKFTSPVGSFAANKYGLYDLGGNVWEWCEEEFPLDEIIFHVARGASWVDAEFDSELGVRGALLSSCRAGHLPVGNYATGFRCVLVTE